MPFGIPSQKGGVHIESILHFVFVFKGRVVFCWLELVELFRLYLGASLCTFTFLALATFALFCWDTYDRGRYLFYMFLVSNCLLTYVYEFFIDICLYCVLFEIKILFYLLVFSTHAVMLFV